LDFLRGPEGIAQQQQQQASGWTARGAEAASRSGTSSSASAWEDVSNNQPEEGEGRDAGERQRVRDKGLERARDKGRRQVAKAQLAAYRISEPGLIAARAVDPGFIAARAVDFITYEEFCVEWKARWEKDGSKGSETNNRVARWKKDKRNPANTSSKKATKKATKENMQTDIQSGAWTDLSATEKAEVRSAAAAAAAAEPKAPMPSAAASAATLGLSCSTPRCE
jgi:hypothetical protein